VLSGPREPAHEALGCRASPRHGANPNPTSNPSAESSPLLEASLAGDAETTQALFERAAS
jgi:hypothetical protein